MMLFLPKSKKEFSVSRELVIEFSKFMNTPRFHRYKEDDSNKSLEYKICEEIFGKCLIRPPVSLDEEFAEIDCYINGEALQVKCRNDKQFLILEDYKTQSNGEKTSWVDRSVAQYTLIVCPGNNIDTLSVKLFETQDLQRLLKLIRLKDKDSSFEFNPIDIDWLNTYFPEWKYFVPQIVCPGKKNESKLFKISI
jgi:hypothetical protein